MTTDFERLNSHQCRRHYIHSLKRELWGGVVMHALAHRRLRMACKQVLSGSAVPLGGRCVTPAMDVSSKTASSSVDGAHGMTQLTRDPTPGGKTRAMQDGAQSAQGGGGASVQGEGGRDLLGHRHPGPGRPGRSPEEITFRPLHAVDG